MATMRYGTAYFMDKQAAVNYYGCASAEAKLAAGEIFIGAPTIKANEKLLIIRAEKRYMIEVTQ